MESNKSQTGPEGRGWLQPRRGSLSMLRLILVVLVLSRALAALAGDDLRAKTQNPVGNLISVPFENSIDFGAPNGSAYFLNIQPVIPVKVGNWNLINRVIVPLIYAGGEIEGSPNLPSGGSGDDVFGLGDINYSVFVSPADAGKVIWGIGPSITLRTATADQIGSGKWSMGPTAVLLTQPQPWTLGLLARNLWSFAGDSDRTDVNQMLLQPFVNYNLSQGWYLTTDPAVTANWEGESGRRWTVPIGGGLGRLFAIGSQPINLKGQAFYNAVRAKNAPDWALKFTIQLLFPK